MTVTSSVGKIYTYPANVRVFKSQIAAKYVGVDIDVELIEFGKTNKTEEFLEKYPLGKVPVLETLQGPLYESDAIAFYIADTPSPTSNILGKTRYERARVQQWVHFSSNELMFNVGNWFFPIAGFRVYDKVAEDKAIENLKRALGALDKELSSRKFLVGDSVTLADIAAATSLYLGYTKLFDKNFREPFPNVNRWFLTLVAEPNFQSILGKVDLCEQPVVHAE